MGGIGLLLGVAWRRLGSQGVVVIAVLEVMRGVDVAADSPGQVCRGWEREYESPFSPPPF